MVPQSPKHNPLLKNNTVGEIQFKKTGTQSTAGKPTGNLALMKQLSRPGLLKKQFTHGGEHNPNWRTREAIAARPKAQQQLLSERALETLEVFGHQTQDGQTTPRIDETKLSEEEIFALKLTQSDPKMLNLRFEDFIPASDIVISPKSGMDIDSEIIGEGGQGTIFRARLKGRDGLVAIKCGHTQGILEEFALLKKLAHPSILQAISYSIARDEDNDEEDSGRTVNSADSQGSLGGLKKKSWVFMAAYEMCAGGDLTSYINKYPAKVQDVNFIKNLFVSLIKALAHLHANGYVHCDLKPENILVDGDGNPKLADFGMCQSFSDHMVPQGTPSFLAPEVVQAWFTPTDPHRFTDKIDMFSLGAMALYVITGRYPFHRVTARLKSGVKYTPEELGLLFSPNKKRLNEIARVSKTLSTMIGLCLQQDIESRPSAAALLSQLS